MIFCIIGPSGCGKTTVVEELVKKGYTSVPSYTTRPKRFENETGHTFITKEEFDKLTDIVAYTHFNNYDYCVTKDMLNNCDFYIIDADGILELSKHNISFITIGLKLSQTDCISRMLIRGDSSSDILDRLQNDKIKFKNYLDLCDYTIDANNSINDIVNQIEEIYNSNKGEN